MSRTAPQSTSNALTPSFSTVSSTAGFQAGDLIYSKDNAYGTIPNNAVSTANFPITSTVAAAQTPYNQTVVNIAESANYTVGNSGRSVNSALLSNGNIVAVGAVPSNGYLTQLIFFRIVDSNFSQVVASTQIGSSAANNGSVSVAALTGGGFVVAWATTSNVAQYAIYNNSGTQTLTVTSVPGFGTMYGVNIKPLANGGFVIAGVNSSNQMLSRTFDASGTAVSSVQTFGSFNYSSSQPLIATFSDSSFSICGNSSASITVYNFNTLGTFTTSTLVVSDFYSSGAYSFTALSDGTTVLAYTENSSGGYYIRGIKYNPSTAVVTSFGYLNTTYSYALSVSVQGLSGGGFVLLAGPPSQGYMSYYIYNNSGSQITRQDIYGLPVNIYYAYSSSATIIEGSTYVTVVLSASNNNYASAALPAVQVLKASPYTLRAITSNTVQVATASASVNGYARSTATPNSAAFLAATTQTLSQSVSPSSGTSFQLTPYSPTSDTFITQAMVTMQNGQFVIAYATTTAIKCIVFNASGTVNQTFTVATGSFSGPVTAVCLGNGKLVVGYPSSSTVVSFSIYSTSYSLLATGSTSAIASGSSVNSMSNGHSMAAMDTTRFVIGYINNNGYPQVVVYDDTGTSVYSAAQALSSCGNPTVGALPGGEFFISYFYGAAGYYYWTTYARNGSSSTYSFTGNANTNYGTQAYTILAAALPAGVGAILAASSTTLYVVRFSMAGNTGGGATGVQVGSSSNFNNVTMCVGSAGNLMVFRADTSDRSYSLFAPTMGTNPLSGVPNYYLTNSITLSDYNANADVYSSAPAITCVYGDTYAFSYRTSSNTMKVGLLSTTSATFSTTITAGVTTSNTALIPSQSNGYYLAGVATSNCVAGGTGVIQTNGTATLNSQYPAGTTAQAFDFTSPTVPVGVKGTIAGRNLTIQGG